MEAKPHFRAASRNSRRRLHLPALCCRHAWRTRSDQWLSTWSWYTIQIAGGDVAILPSGNRRHLLLAGNDSSLSKGSRTGDDVQRRPPVENVPGQAEQHSEVGRKLFGFSPDSCSPSIRNRVRNQHGILFGFTLELRSPRPGFRSHRQWSSEIPK